MRLLKFYGRFRDECLNENWFMSLDHARRTIETWRLDYNHYSPHQSLGYMTPAMYVATAARPSGALPPALWDLPHTGSEHPQEEVGRSKAPDATIPAACSDRAPLSCVLAAVMLRCRLT